MNIELLRAYDEARMLRVSGKKVPSELLHRIKRMEEHFISKDLIPFIEQQLRYFLRDFESPVSIKMEYDPLTHEASIAEMRPEVEIHSTQEPGVLLHASKYKGTSMLSSQTLIAPNQFDVESPSLKRPLQSVSHRTQKKKSPTEDNAVNNTDADIKKYCDDFRRMKRRSGAMGIKKAVMLLSMFDLIGSGHFKSNEMVLDDRLIHKYKILWDKIAPCEKKGENDTCRAFVQLYSESFFRMKLNTDLSNIDGNCSLASVREVVKSVSFDGILFRLVQNKIARVRLIEFLCDLFDLRIIERSITEDQRNLKSKEEPILEDGIVMFDENYDEVDINDFILSSKVIEYSNDEMVNLKPSDLWKAVAIATIGNRKKSFVIYDTTIQPLTKERIIRFMFKTMITRDLLSYKYGSEVSERIQNPNNLDILDSLMKCTLFQEVNPNTGMKTNYILTMNRSIKTFQIYTEYRNLTQKIYECLMGDEHQELPNEFIRFANNVARQAFEPMSNIQ